MTVYTLSQKSNKKLLGVHPDIVRVVKLAITYTPIDFTVTHGVRTQAEQNALYAKGRTTAGPIVTWTKNSKHLRQKDGFGHAVDLAAVIGRKVSWAPQHYDDIAIAMKRAARELKIPIKWGPDIGIKGDLGHYEL